MATVDEVKVAITADTKGLTDGINTSKEAINGFGESTGKANTGFMNTFGKMRDTMQGPIAAFKEVWNVVSRAVEAFGEAEMASVRLTKATENNTLMTGGAADRLSEFASQMQALTIFEGDATVQIMAQLAAMGLSEAQIKRLIKVGMDLASATGEDLDSAVKKLNATLQGSAGQLGRQNSAIKDLTQTQLKNGAALDVLEKQYEGFADTVGNTTAGKIKKLENMWGDLVENVGGWLADLATDVEYIFNPDSDQLRKFIDTVTMLQRAAAATGRGALKKANIDDVIKGMKWSQDEFIKNYESMAKRTDEFSKWMVTSYKTQYDAAVAWERAYVATMASRDAALAPKVIIEAATATGILKKELVDLEVVIEELNQPLQAGPDSRIIWLPDGIKALQDAQKAVADLTSAFENVEDISKDAANTTSEIPQILDNISIAAKNNADEIDYLALAWATLDTSMGNALLGGVGDMFSAMDRAGSDSKDIWAAAGDAFDAFVVDFIDKLPMLLISGGLSLIIGNPAMWAVGLAMIAAGGGIALIDAITTSDAEQKAYRTGKYAPKANEESAPPKVPGEGASANGGTSTDYGTSLDSGISVGVDTIDETTGSSSRSVNQTIIINSPNEKTPAEMRREVIAAGRELAFARG
jgi:hypothetical protein